jgi:hypothetical protein
MEIDQSACLAVTPERQANQWCACDLPVDWSCFNTSEHFRGRVTAIGQRGGCMESNRAVPTGSVVLVRFVDPENAGALMLAEVKCCHPLPPQSPMQYRFRVKCVEYL